MSTITLVIADDQTLLRRSLMGLFERHPTIKVVGEAGDGRSAIQVIRQTRPDIALVDIRMPGCDGIAVTRAVAGDPDLAGTRVLVITMFEAESYVFAALRAGACGFLLKDTSPEGIISAIETAYGGQAPLSPLALRALVQRYVPVVESASGIRVITPRQSQVLQLIGKGLSNDEIETTLQISKATLKSHIAALLDRLQARDRAQLVIAAYEHGLVGPLAPAHDPSA